jgi:hypothetical protein
MVSKLKRPPTSDKGLITRTYRELKKWNSPKISESIKNGQLNQTDLFQRKKYKWPKITWKCLPSLAIMKSKSKPH